MVISFQDVERLQGLYPNNQIELRAGKIIIMGPSDIVSDEIEVRFSTLLSNWVYSRNSGRVLGASAGFRLPNGDLLHTLRGRTDTIYSVVWSPDGQILASGSKDKTIRLWMGRRGNSCTPWKDILIISTI